MPERRGRRRRGRDRARPRPAQALPGPATARERAAPDAADASLPSLRLRYAAFVLAVVTLFLGIVTAVSAITGDAGGVDALARVGTGAALLVLALVIGALSLAPGRIRDWLRRD